SYRTAAVPPSAETEWERITCTLEITAILNFLSVAAADIAARSPARPEPMIKTSCEIVSVNPLHPYIPLRRAIHSHKYLSYNISRDCILIFLMSEVDSTQ